MNDKNSPNINLEPYLEEQSAYENQYLNLRDFEVDKSVKLANKLSNKNNNIDPNQ